MKKELLIVALSVALTGCGQARVETVKPPADLLTCADEPMPAELPSRDGTDATQLQRDKKTLEYVLNLRSAWGDCWSKVDGLRAWVEALDGRVHD